MASDGYCRFSACKQAGLYFKRLDKHLKRCHPGKTKKDNLERPLQNPVNRSLVKHVDRQRKPCRVVGCRFYGIPISRLDRHMKKIHGTNLDSKENRKSVMECSFSEEEQQEQEDSFSAEIARIIDSL